MSDRITPNGWFSDLLAVLSIALVILAIWMLTEGSIEVQQIDWNTISEIRITFL